MRTVVRPENVYQVRRDRAVMPRTVLPEVTVAFRVRFRLEGDPYGHFRVTGLLWEHEAADLVGPLAAVPGVEGISIDPISGTDRRPYKGADTWWWHKRRATEYGARVAAGDPNAATEYFARILSIVPTSVRDEVHEAFLAVARTVAPTATVTEEVRP